MANLSRIVIRRIFCGTYTGHWQACLTVNRLIYVFASGTQTSRIWEGDFSCVLKPGTWLFIPAFQSVHHDQEKGLKLLSIHFNAELFAGMELFADMGHPLSGHAPEKRHDFESFLEQDTTFARAFLLQGVLNGFLAERVLPFHTSPEHLLQRYRGFSNILDAIGHHPYRNLSVDQMASLMKMGRESFVKHFTAEMKESPKAFFNRMRAAAIARELGNPSLSVSEIAIRFGFSSIHYFSRFFKRHLGTSPEAYRRQSRI